MVSGFVTSPCDQLRIFSGEARLMRIASKSAIGFARSNGLERNKISSTSCGLIAAASGSVIGDQWQVASDLKFGKRYRSKCRRHLFQKFGPSDQPVNRWSPATFNQRPAA